ncbi:chromate transporter [Inhella gelatinilytica]|uniref:Chromate transporter n=1 Tax=Inhella gelatinilytica TaxID=2795030 RepID=A0A931IWN9_9BURK|nr:chromate transporter [Inhella gelatinilytica]MBH9552941.1 chromate transporter [Inhella gelatinilytica]
MMVSPTELLALSADFALLSLLSLGGVNAILADSHRLLVAQRGWLTDTEFAQAVALGQAAPGPNVMVVGVLGWMAAGPWGLFACLGGILLPSTWVVWRFSRWAEAHPGHAGLRAFQEGCGPLVMGLTLSGAWVLIQPYAEAGGVAWGLVGLIAVGSARKRWPPLIWLTLGATAGVLGWV